MSQPDTPLEPLVAVENLHTYYGKSHILHGVSLDVGPGEVVGLLGRNGVGKSTTLKSIMGLVNPSEGTITFHGQSITREPPHKIARIGIGYVPEDRRIFKLLTVMENLLSGRLGYVSAWRAWRRKFPPEDIARAYELLDVVGRDTDVLERPHRCDDFGLAVEQTGDPVDQHEQMAARVGIAIGSGHSLPFQG